MIACGPAFRRSASITDSTRIQFSAFMGKLSRSMREELFLKLCAQLNESPARILMQPICDHDEGARKVREVNAHLLGRVPPDIVDQSVTT